MSTKSLTLLLLPLIYTGLTHALPSPSPATAALDPRQITIGTLFGPITLPSISISNVSLSLFSFGDEVLDISSISIFGDVNEGGNCNQAADAPAPPETRPGGTVVLGPVDVPASLEIRDVQMTLFNFQDEVVDVSSISVFGDVNGGNCAGRA